jgi:hypothetical protein
MTDGYITSSPNPYKMSRIPFLNSFNHNRWNNKKKQMHNKTIWLLIDVGAKTGRGQFPLSLYKVGWGTMSLPPPIFWQKFKKNPKF